MCSKSVAKPLVLQGVFRLSLPHLCSILFRIFVLLLSSALFDLFDVFWFAPFHSILFDAFPFMPPPLALSSLLSCPFAACEMHFWWQLMEFLLPLKRALWWPDQNTPHSYKSLPFPLPLHPPPHSHFQSQLTWHLFVLHGTREGRRDGVCVVQMIVGGWLILLKSVRHLSGGR